MKSYFISTLLLLVAVCATAQVLPKVTELSMRSAYFTQERQVLIYTPVAYNEYTASRYDVIYVFDSQERAKFDLVHCLRDLACSQMANETKFFIIDFNDDNAVFFVREHFFYQAKSCFEVYKVAPSVGLISANGENDLVIFIINGIYLF